ncbi:TIGR02391 family protein [Streptomyces spiralis]|uniref:TIGR02391 family protein n=1 Tax=Streptomyces spiralis TaxID=66376 RepID=UPI0033DB79AB
MGDEGHVLLDAIWVFFVRSRRWPTFDDVDRMLYSADLEFEDAVQQLCPALLRGLDPNISQIPQGMQELSLTIAGAANCAGTEPAIRVFLEMVRTAAMNERLFHPSEPGEQPTLDPGDMRYAASGMKFVSPPVAFVAASLAMNEPCFRGGTRNPETLKWSLTCDRGIRPFADVSGLDDYWRIREKVVGPVRAETENRPFQKDAEPVFPPPPPASPVVPSLAGTSLKAPSVATDSAEPMSVTCNLHPLIAKVAEERYRRGAYNDAVRSAFQEVEHRVATLVGGNLIGERLMGVAFGTKPDPPKITVTRSTGGSLESEQNGMQFLFKGAMLALRNPRSHGPDAKDDRDEADEMLAFASFLMRRLDIEDAEREKATGADATSAP